MEESRQKFLRGRATVSRLALGALVVAAVPALAWAHGMSHADVESMTNGGYGQYVWIGAKHMLTGWDHLLFIFGVIFFLTGFRDILKYITAFTVGHSITLLGATLMGITANEHAVDAVIALSVVYKGFENLDGFKKYVGIKAPNLLFVVFAFGLVHGFGLATRLQQLPLGLGTDGLVQRILCFNVGVELGQIVALVFMVQAISLWRKRDSFTRFTTFANGGLATAGALLFALQMHSYLHTAHPDALGFAGDLHHHAHEDMQAESDAAAAAAASNGSNAEAVELSETELREPVREELERDRIVDRHQHPHEHPHDHGSSE